MPHFYFNQHLCGELIEDQEGHACADLQAAELWAIRVARKVMAEEVKAGELCIACNIDILDDHRRFLKRVPFRRALIVTGV